MISPPGPGWLRMVFDEEVSARADTSLDESLTKVVETLSPPRCLMISLPGQLREVFDDKPARVAQEGVS